MSSESTEFDAVQFFSSAKGRLNRQPYNILVIISSVIAIVLGALVSKMSVRSTPASVVAENVKNLCTEASKKYSTPGRDVAKDIQSCIKEELSKAYKSTPLNPKGLIPILGLLLLWLLTICPAIKRLHDRDKSGWWYLGFALAFAIPFINIIASIWFLVETSFLPGTAGPNDYGPDPLA